VNATRERLRGRRHRHAEETLDALARLRGYPGLDEIEDLPRERAGASARTASQEPCRLVVG